jgi:hypothetical protein
VANCRRGFTVLQEKNLPTNHPFSKILSMGHHREKLDWKRFIPTNAVNRKNQGLTQ